ncbi:MAG: DoxX family protein [Luteolibacter sp.]|uniref:DoxX family protein n=1 Tax=Luteolibacter sp. TaxID=1962973 RepID=UPI0032663179
MDLNRKSQVVALIARVSLGVWFVYSGGVKIFGSGLDRFTFDVSNYKLVSAPWDAVAAYTVPWFELIAGVCLMLGILRRGALLTIFGLVVVFSVSVGWAWAHGLDISCGCHGGDTKIQYWSKAAELTGYFLLLGWLWWMEIRRSYQSHVV